MLGRLRRSVGQQFAATVLTFALVLQSVALAVAAGLPIMQPPIQTGQASNSAATTVPQATMATRPCLAVRLSALMLTASSASLGPLSHSRLRFRVRSSMFSY
jgi:hypothetical protein